MKEVFLIRTIAVSLELGRRTLTPLRVDGDRYTGRENPTT